MRRIHKRISKRMKKHQRRNLNFLEALRLYAGMPVL
jgi:hypothetical protein